MKRTHALVISALVAAAVVLGVATAFEATSAQPQRPAITARTDVDATVARETRRLDGIKRQLDKALRDNPPPKPKPPVVRYVTGPATAASRPSTTFTASRNPSAGTSEHEDDHHADDHGDGHETEHGSGHESGEDD